MSMKTLAIDQSKGGHRSKFNSNAYHSMSIETQSDAASSNRKELSSAATLPPGESAVPPPPPPLLASPPPPPPDVAAPRPPLLPIQMLDLGSMRICEALRSPWQGATHGFHLSIQFIDEDATSFPSFPPASPATPPLGPPEVAAPLVTSWLRSLSVATRGSEATSQVG